MKDQMLTLGDLQLAVLHILWEKGEANAQEVHQTLQTQRDAAFTTVATVLSRLDKQKVISHRTEGRTFIYSPLVSEQDVQRSMLNDLKDKAFKGNAATLVSQLLQANDISDTELASVKALIEAAEKEGTQ